MDTSPKQIHRWQKSICKGVLHHMSSGEMQVKPTVRHHHTSTAAAAKSLQSCPTLCDPIDGSPPGSPVPGILQARTLEWVAISFSNAGQCKVKVKSLSRVQSLATPWTAAYQAPPSMGFSRQEQWSGLPLPSPTHLLTQPRSRTLAIFSAAEDANKRELLLIAGGNAK